MADLGEVHSATVEARASWPLMKALGRGSGRVMQKQQRFQTLGRFCAFLLRVGSGHGLTWIENILQIVADCCRLLQIVADYEIMAGKNVRICCIIWSIRKLCSAAVLMD